MSSARRAGAAETTGASWAGRALHLTFKMTLSRKRKFRQDLSSAPPRISFYFSAPASADIALFFAPPHLRASFAGALLSRALARTSGRCVRANPSAAFYAPRRICRRLVSSAFVPRDAEDRIAVWLGPASIRKRSRALLGDFRRGAATTRPPPRPVSTARAGLGSSLWKFKEALYQRRDYLSRGRASRGSRESGVARGELAAHEGLVRDRAFLSLPPGASCRELAFCFLEDVT